MRIPTAAVVMVVAFAPACAPTTDWAGNIDERDGVVDVDNPGGGLWDGREGPPFRLELEQVFGVEDAPVEAILATVLGGKSFAVDGDANVYVLDREADQIVAFAPDGSVRWRAGRSGQAPGEISRANGIAWDGAGTLYTSLQNGARLDAWDLDGNHVDTWLLPSIGMSTAYVVGALDTETLVLWEWGKDRDGVTVWVLFLAGDPEVRAEFFVSGGDEDDPGLMDGTNIEVSVGGGRIHTGHRIEYLIRSFDADGNLLRVTRRHVPNLVPTLTHGGTGFNFGEFFPALVLDDGYILVPHSRLPNIESAARFVSEVEVAETYADLDNLLESESTLDLLDAQGQYLGSVSYAGNFDAIGKPQLIGPDGKLYTRTSNPFPQVRRYRVEF